MTLLLPPRKGDEGLREQEYQTMDPGAYQKEDEGCLVLTSSLILK